MFTGAAFSRDIFELLNARTFYLPLLFMGNFYSPGYLSFFTLILLIPFPRIFIFYGAAVPYFGGGVGGFFSADSPLETNLVLLILNFILIPLDPNEAWDALVASACVGKLLAANGRFIEAP